MKRRAYQPVCLFVLLMVAGAALVHALGSGAITVGWAGLQESLIGADTPAADIVRRLRLPRALGTFACGGLLALAGALMQVLLRNPLADPYVLGISGGSAVGVLLAMLAGLPFIAIEGCALGGALAVMLLVMLLAHGPGGWTPTRMLLTGVIISAGCAALIALVLSISPATQLPGMLFWLMGDAGNVTHPWPALILLLAAVVLTTPFARDFNLLATGALNAQALGVPVARLQIMIYLTASLLTAVSVSAVGAVGFVGLIVPHALRLTVGQDHRVLLPACALAGGSLLTLADTLARTVASPLQLPVGVLMALIGVPVFLWLLAREGQRP